MSLLEKIYHKKHLHEVAHTTFDPYGPGVVRIHMVPPKWKWFGHTPSVVIINGQDVLPLSMAWTVLLNEFIKQVNRYDGKEIQGEALDDIIRKTVKGTRRVYPFTGAKQIKQDLQIIIDTLCDVAYGKEPQTEIGYMSLAEYAPNMRAPHRMDLMVSAMTKEGKWHCNQKCMHCYASGQPFSETKELSTAQWKEIIQRCKEAGIPQLTFTGGEPTLREDLVECIRDARWFVTRLNTNGVLLTPELCEQLYQAELDSLQVTLYSHDAAVHNQLVGAANFEKTVEGIQNAITAGLNVSVNTPLCSLNQEYATTLEFLHSLGVRYVSCSGLIVTGNACTEDSKQTQLSQESLFEILQQAVRVCYKNNMEISFTSPGWLEEEQLTELGLTVPSCGACLSNMAIAPDGSVLPCQSWLTMEQPLGNMLQDDWNSIWESKTCTEIRNQSVTKQGVCPLRQKGEV